jgi:hypothetical protein
MDPGSIIAIAMLAAQVCASFADLRSVCQSLPGRLHAVNNEVADLELVLFQIACLIQERQCLPESKQSAIPHLLKQAGTKLKELKSIVDRLTTNCRNVKIPIIGAHVWRREQHKLQALQEDIRTVKCSLNILLGASNS